MEYYQRKMENIVKDDCIPVATEKKTIAIWGPHGFGNMGNEMTMAAVIQNLRKLEPDVLLYGFTWDAEDTARRHGIRAFPARAGGKEASPRAAGKSAISRPSEAAARGWKTRLKRNPKLYAFIRWMAKPVLLLQFWRRTLARLKNVDLVVIAGTGPFQDNWGGATAYPFFLFQWSKLCRLSHTKLAVVSTGAGPIDSSLSKALLRSALSGTVYRSFRDEESRSLIRSLGFKREVAVYPDLAFSLNLPEGAASPTEDCEREVVITGIPFRKPGSWENPSSKVYEPYLNAMAGFASWLLSNGYVVRLVPTQFSMDPVFIEDIREKLRREHDEDMLKRLVVEKVETFEEMIDQLSKGSIVVTSRFHGVIFSYLLNKPVLGIAYHSKTRRLMESFGQGQFCLDLDAVDCERLCELFLEIEASREEISRQVHDTKKHHRAKLDYQYSELLSL